MFTNFTQDHLDYHGDMANYWQAKRALFDWDGLQAVVVNVDDAKGAALAQELKARGDVTVWTVSCQVASDAAHHLQATHITHGEQGLCFDVLHQGKTYRMDTRLVGHYNVSNMLGVIAGLCALHIDVAQAVSACNNLPAVPGRMQAVGGANAPLVVVDYAHTPDAVAQAAQALQPLAASRGGQLVCLLGCGGDRDASKRPLMAAAAKQHAHTVVLTSDNPRSEDPQHIVAQMLAGLTQRDAVQVVLDRAEAIAQTVSRAHAQDVILVAGKGHEDYQEIAGIKHPFSDVQHARDALQQRRAHV
jgi:UDP-N-acetylmuramoyl-L-alanyl-D-glutamate--2,6-diaminopimelate ligase